MKEALRLKNGTSPHNKRIEPAAHAYASVLPVPRWGTLRGRAFRPPPSGCARSSSERYTDEATKTQEWMKLGEIRPLFN
jgi:hypothetical protein